MSDTAVTDTDTPAQTGTEGTDARKPVDDLDALLKEFGAGGEQTPATQPDKQTQTDAAVTDPALKTRLEAVERKLQDDAFNQAIQPVVKTIRGDVPADVFSDQEVIDWMDGQARRDPRLAKAWLDRDKNPQGFERVVGALSKQFRSKFSKQPDAGATEDAAAVADAVRGASGKQPPGKPPDYGSMSTQDFAKDVEAKYGFRPL